jgi:hypothetical protein
MLGVAQEKAWAWRGPDLPQHRRRGDRPTRPLVQKRHELPVALQPRDVPSQEDPIHRPDLERDVIGEQA